MLKNFLKVALRSLHRNKIYSVINISGLTIGLTCTILLLLWVRDEMTYDSYHKNQSNIYQVMENQHYADRIGTTSSTPSPLTPYLKETYPEIAYATRITWESENLFTVEEKAFYENGRYVDADFFQMFTFEFLEGSADKPYDGMHSVVLTEKLAKKYFGEKPALGQTIKMNNKKSFTVTGVVKSWPKNTTNGDFDYLINFEFFHDENKQWLDQWGNNNVRAFIQTQENITQTDLEQKISRLLDEKNEDNVIDLFLNPLSRVHLYSNWENGVQDGGRITNVRVFTSIAFLILLIACINFMNLATAQAVKRAKEVGLRKVVGAFRSSLIAQFLSESILFSVFAGLLSVALVWVLLPGFNSLTGKNILFALEPMTIAILIGLILLAGFFSGSYPAFYIARFQPAHVLKGQIKSGNTANVFRKILVTLQFLLSIFMIFCTIVVYKQLVFVQDRETGFSKDGLIYVEMHESMNEKLDVIKNQLRENPAIENVAAMSLPPFGFGNNTWGFDWPGKDPQAKILFTNLSIDNTFAETFEIPLAAGRSFSAEFTTDTLHFMINEEAAKVMGFTPEEAVNQPVTLWGDRKGNIIGVFKDFNFSSAHSAIRPLLLIHDPDWYNYIVVRSQPGQHVESIQALQNIYQEFSPAYPFEYHFVDDTWKEFYEGEARTAHLFNAFAIIAIFISCLGLFGLAAFTIQQRTKEIGIRKVLGASVYSIVGITTREFALLVFIASLIGTPLAWYAMNIWLSDFAFRIEIDLMIPVFSTIIAIAVALLTVTYHALKASTTNPVSALRYE